MLSSGIHWRFIGREYRSVMLNVSIISTLPSSGCLILSNSNVCMQSPTWHLCQIAIDVEWNEEKKTTRQPSVLYTPYTPQIHHTIHHSLRFKFNNFLFTCQLAPLYTNRSSAHTYRIHTHMQRTSTLAFATTILHLTIEFGYRSSEVAVYNLNQCYWM